MLALSMPRRSGSVLWGVGAAVAYAASAAPGVVWADSAKLTLYALHAYLPSLNPGDHAGWTALAQLWLAVTSWLSPPRALNLLSALAAAVVVGGVHALLLRWGENRQAAHGAAAVLLVSHPLWWAAAVAESYTPALALVVVGALGLTRRTTLAHFAGGLSFGLAVAAHAFALALVVPLVLRACRRRGGAVVAGALAGAAPLWLAVFGSPPDPLTGYAAGGPASWGWHVAAFLRPSRVLVGLALVGGGALAALGPLGLWGVARRVREGGVSRHPHPGLAVLALGLLGLLLTAYSPYRLHLMVVFLILGVVLVAPPQLSLRACVLHLTLQAAVYGGAAVGAHLLERPTLGLRQLPGRDNARYFLWPVKWGERGPERWAGELLAAAPPQAVVLADFNPGAVLRLVQELTGVRPDVEVIPTAVDDALAATTPARALAERVLAYLGEGRAVVLADSWPPYYPLEELRAMGLTFSSCGPGLKVGISQDPR